MAQEDILLREEMGRLEIEKSNLRRSKSDENPFYNFLAHTKKGGLRKAAIARGSCSCTTSHNKNASYRIYKRKNNKILKEPVLEILKKNVYQKSDLEDCQPMLNTSVNQSAKIDTLSLCTLVKNCNQLKISSEANELVTKGNNENDKTKWWKTEVCSRESREARHSNQTGSCSQQALNPPCDITIDELASYFETLVHIPKKMSSMAEMMYI